MNYKEEYFNTFNKNDFEVIVRTLETQGYVIDGKEEEGVSFSSNQIEHMSQEMFNKLCAKFKILCDIKVSKTGHFYSDNGAFYIVYNEKFYKYEEARRIMDKYITNN